MRLAIFSHCHLVENSHIHLSPDSPITLLGYRRMKERRSFLSNFIMIGASTIINMIISLLTTPIITRIVDPDIYGQLSIFSLYTSMAMLVLCLGLDQSLVRYFYQEDTLKYKSSLLKICISYPVLITIPLLIVTYISSLTGVIKFEFESPIILLLCVNILVGLFHRMSLLVLRITYQGKKYAVCNILTKVTYVLLALILIFSVKKNYFAILAISTVISVLIPTLYALLSAKEYWNFKYANYPIDKVKVIKYGLPLIFAQGITQLFQALDKLSLNKYRTYTEVGIYSSAMSIVNIFAIIQTTFNTLWGPMQVEHYTKHPDDTEYIAKANQYITTIMFFLGLSLILCKDIFALLLGPKFRDAAYIVPFLIFNPIMYTVSETTVSGIEKSNKSYLNILVGAIACAFNYAGNTILVPTIGGKGAAISTGISYILFWAARTFFSNKYYYINYHLKKFAVITILTLLYAGYNTFIKFNIFSIVFYVIDVIVLIILYKESIGELIAIGKKHIIKQIK